MKDSEVLLPNDNIKSIFSRNFNKIIDELTKNSNYSNTQIYEQICEKLDIDLKSVRNWVTGKHLPKENHLNELCSILNCTRNDLYTDNNEFKCNTYDFSDFSKEAISFFRSKIVLKRLFDIGITPDVSTINIIDFILVKSNYFNDIRNHLNSLLLLYNDIDKKILKNIRIYSLNDIKYKLNHKYLTLENIKKFDELYMELYQIAPLFIDDLIVYELQKYIRLLINY